jgi:hypothetical protein
LSQEDVTFKESPSRRIPSIHIPKSVKEVNESGFLAWGARLLGFGGRHHEEHLKADEFRHQLKKHSHEQLRWMEDEAKPAIIANAIERRRAIMDELNRRIQMLKTQERSQVDRETRLKVANAMQELLVKMPHTVNSKTDSAYNNEHPESKETYHEIEVAPLTGTLLAIAGRILDRRLLCLRKKALAIVAKRTGNEAAQRVLIFGFDSDSIEHFLNVFWMDLSEKGLKISEGFTELRATKPFEAVAVCHHNDEVGDKIAESVHGFLSGPTTLFLMVDLEQIGSAMKQIDRSRILEHLREEVGLVVVVQSVRGMFHAQKLSEGIIYLRAVVERFALQVDAVLVNSDETFFTTAMDTLFERGGRHATLQDEQDFLEAVAPSDPRERQIAEQMLRGWRDYRHSNTD